MRPFTAFGRSRYEVPPGPTVTPTIASVSGANGSGTVSPAYGANSAGDLFAMCVVSIGGTVTTPSGWTLQAGPATQGTINAYWYTRDTRSTGSESGTVTVTNSASFSQAIIVAISGVATSSFSEGPGTNNGTTTTVGMPTVAATGNHRLALAAVFADAGLNGMSSATGESGGDWTEAAAEQSSGLGWAFQVQSADLASGGTISGGSQTVTGTTKWCAAGFALVGT